MRLGLIAHGLHVAGGRSVAQNIISALAVVANDYEFLLVMPKGVGYEEINKPRRSECHYVANEGSIIKRSIYDFYTLPRKMASWHPDVVFCLGNYGLILKQTKQAILYHKAHFVYPEVEIELSAKEKIKNALIKHQISRSLRYTDLVFCQTEALKVRFIKTFSPHCDVKILPNVVSANVSLSESGLAALPEPLASGLFANKYKLFALTRYYAHKNLEILVETFNQFRHELSDVVFLLTINADDHPRASALIEKINTLGLSENFINLGTVDQQLLPSLYEYSDALILPTLLESFSGTYVEAMQFQRPILTSDRDFAHAVCGEAASYFDPHDTQAICNAILNLKNNAPKRKELATAGVHQLATMATDWPTVVKSAVQQLKAL